MKAREMRDMTKDELLSRLEEIEEELFTIRMRPIGQELADSRKVRNLKREKARILTVLREDTLGIRVLNVHRDKE